ncbi:MAG TPA: sigma 54-interacting transcriptional regulator [Acidobacteriaceae bacterium]|jgi:formate hydrogenlyase transcriptional activator|nr:sigma 54-interacting transcriptional regulator [Acidobacteriaceae bacterium]
MNTMVSNGLIGSSPAFRAILDDIAMVAPLDSVVLVQGETGSGKEVVARAIHDCSPRRGRPFVAVNCAAIPAALLESQLFGHEKGAFTGAIAQTLGRFHAADRGTLFLDEIGDLPLELQPKLLRVLQDRRIERIGSNRSIPVDARIIAATNLDLQQMVHERTFRADLYYRLNVFPMALPALRERREDIPLLVRYFVAQLNVRIGRRVEQIPEYLLARLMEYSWPGNIRELQNFVERALITSPGTILTPRPCEMHSLTSRSQSANPVTLADAQRRHIEQTLAETNWTVSGRHGAATRLGLPRTTLISRMEKLGISRPDRAASAHSVPGEDQAVAGSGMPDFETLAEHEYRSQQAHRSKDVFLGLPDVLAPRQQICLERTSN